MGLVDPSNDICITSQGVSRRIEAPNDVAGLVEGVREAFGENELPPNSNWKLTFQVDISEGADYLFFLRKGIKFLEVLPTGPKRGSVQQPPAKPQRGKKALGSLVVGSILGGTDSNKIESPKKRKGGPATPSKKVRPTSLVNDQQALEALAEVLLSPQLTAILSPPQSGSRAGGPRRRSGTSHRRAASPESEGEGGGLLPDFRPPTRCAPKGESAPTQQCGEAMGAEPLTRAFSPPPRTLDFDEEGDEPGPSGQPPLPPQPHPSPTSAAPPPPTRPKSAAPRTLRPFGDNPAATGPHGRPPLPPAAGGGAGVERLTTEGAPRRVEVPPLPLGRLTGRGMDDPQPPLEDSEFEAEVSISDLDESLLRREMPRRGGWKECDQAVFEATGGGTDMVSPTSEHALKRAVATTGMTEKVMKTKDDLILHGIKERHNLRRIGALGSELLAEEHSPGGTRKVRNTDIVLPAPITSSYEACNTLGVESAALAVLAPPPLLTPRYRYKHTPDAVLPAKLEASLRNMSLPGAPAGWRTARQAAAAVALVEGGEGGGPTSTCREIEVGKCKVVTERCRDGAQGKLVKLDEGETETQTLRLTKGDANLLQMLTPSDIVDYGRLLGSQQEDLKHLHESHGEYQEMLGEFEVRNREQMARNKELGETVHTLPLDPEILLKRRLAESIGVKTWSDL